MFSYPKLHSGPVAFVIFEMLFLLFGVCSIYFSVTFVWVSVLLILDTSLTMGFTFVPGNIIVFVGDTTCRTMIYHIEVLTAPVIYKGTTDEIGKCVLTAALPKVWAREAVNSLSHSWRFGRDHPTCCKYPARRRRGGGRSVRAGWRSPLSGWSAIKIWIVAAQRCSPSSSKESNRAKGGGGGPLARDWTQGTGAAISSPPGILQSVTRSTIFVFRLFQSPLFEVRSSFDSFLLSFQ